VLIARIIAVLILLVFALLMMNLHSRLRRLEAEQQSAPTAQPSR
jgi:hypothetical protein